MGLLSTESVQHTTMKHA